MRKKPFKAVLEMSREEWDNEGVRPVVRENFDKVLKCRTPALGSEVFASANEFKVVHHTCKSRMCMSCGHWRTKLWQREQWASLPDASFAGIVLTMPDFLWQIFRTNRHLLNDLPALGFCVIKRWAQEKYGATLMVMVAPHTFGRHLNFNPHLHILVSKGGFREADGSWVRSLSFPIGKLMERWRYAVIGYLQEVLQLGALKSEHGELAIIEMLNVQQKRRWKIHVDVCTSKKHFLIYAARYIRRPPLAEYRILSVTPNRIRFRTKDHKLRREVVTTYTLKEFIECMSDHVPDHYVHSIRYFGLLAPRSKGRTSAMVFALLGQQKQSKPRRISWNHSIQCSFGENPLIDKHGQRMRWIGRRVAV